MKALALATNPLRPKTKNVRWVALLYAAALVAFATSQLFSFEDFLNIVSGYGLFDNELVERLKAVFVVVAEVFALPFLLRMKLSWLMRIISMICGWLVAMFWFGISLWLVVANVSPENIGFLGSVVTLTPGWWAVLMSVGFGILSAWASWGMWPIARKKLPTK